MTRVRNDREVEAAAARPESDDRPAPDLPPRAVRETRPTARGSARVLHRAAAAYERGDRYLQIQQPIRLNAGTTAADLCSSGGRVDHDLDLLGALADIGWELEHVAYVPVDPPTRTGEAVAPLVRFTDVIGVYLLQADHRPRPYPRDTPA